MVYRFRGTHSESEGGMTGAVVATWPGSEIVKLQHATEPRLVTPTEAAWCAGFLDGDGCLSVRRHNGRISIDLRATNTVRAPLDRLQRVFGGTVRLQGRMKPPRLPAYRWYCRQSALLGVLSALIPHLTVKRAEAVAAVAFLTAHAIGPEEEAAIERVIGKGRSKRARAGASRR